MSSAENLVCSVVICNPIGLAIPASRSECLKVNRDFAIYIATLGFWDKPPKCYSRDENCHITGKASTAQISPEHCVDIEEDKQAACIAALGVAPEGYCDQFNGLEESACRDVQKTGQLDEDYCEDLYRAEDNEYSRFNAWENDERFKRCEQLYRVGLEE